MNKWDLVANKDTAEWSKKIKNRFKFASYAPILYTSAKTGQGVDKVMPEILQVYAERQKENTHRRGEQRYPAGRGRARKPKNRNKELKVFYVTQADVDPPTFVFFTNDAKMVHFSYRRFLENRLRQAYGFIGDAFKIDF